MEPVQPALTITKEALDAAFVEWEKRARKRLGMRAYDECEALPLEQVAKERSDYLWNLLSAPTTTHNMTV